MTDGTPEEYFSVHEIREQLRLLSAEDFARLLLGARAYAKGSSFTAHDILDQAVLASLSGDRRRRRDLELLSFLFGAMKSIAFNERKKAKSNALDKASEMDVDIVDMAVHYDDALALMISAEDARARIELLADYVKDNENAGFVLEGWLDDMSPAEVREATGMTATQYDSARKYLNRRLNAAKHTRLKQ